MTLKIASWNINSVRLRINLVKDYCSVHQPDILCLQETKTQNEFFPLSDFESIGYNHVLYDGEKSYNGVAIISKVPLDPLACMDVTGDSAKRHIAAYLPQQDICLHNFYIPAGGDEPDPAINPKFANKLAFLTALTTWTRSVRGSRAIMLGDFNIAPYEHDVWSHKQLLDVVSHTPIEVDMLNALRDAGGWIDTARAFIPHHQKNYSWWSYRNRDWRESNRGRRLDHIWVTSPLESTMVNYHSYDAARDWEKPSDHIPIMLELNV
jgi:exodeoxyribonuclease III